MEHLNLLMIRDKLAEMEPRLTRLQRDRLRQADQTLVRLAGHFLQAIQAIADLEAWREQEHATADRWWWYLDVIAYLPLFETLSTEPAIPPQPVAAS